MKTILDLLIILTTPSFWLQNYSYSREWNAALNHLMKAHKFENIDQYTARIGGVEIWIANHPYASFISRKLECRPSRLTILRARRKLISDSVPFLP